MIATVLLSMLNPNELNLLPGYITGSVIALFLLGYLAYSLLKPEKF